MPELVERFMQADTNRKTSASVWKGCPLQAIRDEKKGIISEDDFDSFFGTGNRYNIVGTNASIVPILTAPGGQLNIVCTNSQNGEAYLVDGIALGAWGSIIQNTPNGLWWEARFKVNDITNGAYFIGLARASDVAAGFMANSTEAMVATAKYIGFKTAQATPSKLDIVYADAAAATVYATAAATLATGTFVKVGIRFDGNNGGKANFVHFYVNGTEIAQDTTGTLGVSAGASNFPDGVPFTNAFGSKTNASASLTLTLDWFRGANVIEDTTYGQA